MTYILKSYAGIGSRKVDHKTGQVMTEIATFLSQHGYILNSGGASGSDDYFEKGAPPEMRKIYLPWNGFQGKYVNGRDYIIPPENLDLVNKYHPKPNSLSSKAKLLMSRNSYQVLGDNLDVTSKVNFVLCWTQDGGISGGTGQAMRIANDYGIPVFNLNGNMDGFKFYVETFIL